MAKARVGTKASLAHPWSCIMVAANRMPARTDAKRLLDIRGTDPARSRRFAARGANAILSPIPPQPALVGWSSDRSPDLLRQAATIGRAPALAGVFARQYEANERTSSWRRLSDPPRIGIPPTWKRHSPRSSVVDSKAALRRRSAGPAGGPGRRGMS